MKCLVFLLSCSLSMAAWSQQLNFATEATYPPFVSVDANNTVSGFETEIIQAACELMEAECVFSNQPWESLIIGVKLGKFDAVYGGMEITEPRKEHVAFTQPIYQNEVAILVPATENLSFNKEILAGKTIGVQGGTTLEQFLLTEYKGVVNVKAYTSIRDALLDLRAGRVAAVLGDKPVLAVWRQENATDTLALVDLPEQYATFFGDGYGIAVNQKNVELLEELNTALQTLQTNNTYRIIYERYFSSVED